MSEELIPLGLEDKDRVASSLGGGLPKRSLILVEGVAGSGKSTWCQRIAKGVCSENRKVTYVSAEEDVFSFTDQMRSLSYDISKELLQQDLLFLRADTSSSDQSVCLVDRLLSSDVPWRSDITIIDNFGRIVKCDDKNGFVPDGRKFIERFERGVSEVLSEGKSVVLAVDPESMPDGTIRPLRNFSTVQIRLNAEVSQGRTQNYAEIRQYKNMKDRVDDVINYTIESGRGISIQNRTIA